MRLVTGDPDTPRPRLLLADDEASISSNLAPLLMRAGFDVEIVANGTTALAALAAGGFDACVLDVLMPGIDGREVVRRLRKQGSSIPVLL